MRTFPRRFSFRFSGLSIRYRLMLPLLLGAVPVVLLTLYFSETIRGANERKVLADVMATARANADAVSEFATGIHHAQTAVALTIARENMEPGDISVYLREVHRRLPVMGTLAFADASGKLLASSPDWFGLVDVKKLRVFRLISDGADFATGDIIPLPGTDSRVFIAAHRMQSQGKFAGVLLSAMSSHELYRFVAAHAGSEAGYSILNAQGQVMVSTSFADRAAEERMDRSELLGVRRALAGRATYISPFTDADGVEKYGAAVPIQDTDWVLTVLTPTSEATAAIRRTTIVNIALEIIVLTILLITAWAVGSSLAGPIQSLAKKAEKVAAGDFSQRMDIGDEAELGILAHAFNHMTDELQASTAHERTSREHAEFMADISEVLSSSMDTSLILHTVAQKAATFVGDVIMIASVGPEGNVEPEAVYSEDPEMQRRVRMFTRSEQFTSGRTLASKAVREERTIFVPRVSELEDPIQRGYQEQLGVTSVVAAPMRVRGKVTGVLVIASSERELNEEQAFLAEELARRVDLALENIRLYEEALAREQFQKELADTLQNSLLSGIPESVAGFELASFYSPALSEAAVGGDFYDYIELGGSQRGVVVGDVSGKGLEAAVVTAMAKYLIRAYAAENPAPDSVVTRTNDAMCKYVGPDRFVTLAYGILDLSRKSFRFSSAGHEPLLVYRRKGNSVRYERPTGTAAGVLPGRDYESLNIRFRPGDFMMLYTDGLTDVRLPGGGFLEQEGLAKLVVDLGDLPAQELVSTLVERLTEMEGVELRDDIVILVIRAV